ncbi:MAG TPA: twin-arginine translocation signal domain-containing protein [Acidimicrobiales bacterium]
MTAAVDLAPAGIHRDPTSHDPLGGRSFSQRMVRAASNLMSRKSSRRSFLTKTAMVGSALAVAPLDFILKPGSAYAFTCGSCGDGWTAFCCTINSGANSCPSYSFVGGWWKADNAAYCCGAARYIIDCNASCPTKCSCRCSGASCDDRRTCCNQFRYGQCNQQISCYGPVVCRVATCTPPWKYDPSCTSSSATDNATVNHGAPCISTDCGTPIDLKYKALGGASGALGPVTQTERAVGDGRGRYALYRNGAIYWSSSTGAHEVHGAILTSFNNRKNARGVLKYPTTDTVTTSDKQYRCSTFEGGRIYYRIGNGLTYVLPEPYFTEHQKLGGGAGVLGYPTSRSPLTTADKRATSMDFAHGRIYQRGTSVNELHSVVFDKFVAISGTAGVLGYPLTDLVSGCNNTGKVQWFERGHLFYRPGGVPVYEVHGAILDRYVDNGYCAGDLGWPITDTVAVGDNVGKYSEFQHGRIYYTAQLQGHEVSGPVLTAYLGTYGGPTGSLGYPTGELTKAGSVFHQQFQHGQLTYDPSGPTVTNP